MPGTCYAVIRQPPSARPGCAATPTATREVRDPAGWARAPRCRKPSRAGAATGAHVQAEPREGERAGRGQPGVLDQILDRDRVRLLAERSGGAGRARVLGERAGVLADGDVVEGGV